MPKVLIVEDDAQVRYLYEQAIKFQGIEVETASSSEEAVQKLETTPIDLVVLDLLLPGENGLDFLGRLRREMQSGRDIPIVIVTHLQDDEVKRQAMVLGVSSYLSKADHSVGDIVREVRNHLGS